MLKLSSFKATLIFTVNPTPKSYINFHTQQRQIFILLRPKPKPNIENHFKIFRSSNLAQAVHGLLWNVTIASALQLDFFWGFRKEISQVFSLIHFTHPKYDFLLGWERKKRWRNIYSKNFVSVFGMSEFCENKSWLVVISREEKCFDAVQWPVGVFHFHKVCCFWRELSGGGVAASGYEGQCWI